MNKDVIEAVNKISQARNVLREIKEVNFSGITAVGLEDGYDFLMASINGFLDTLKHYTAEDEETS